MKEVLSQHIIFHTKINWFGISEVETTELVTLECWGNIIFEISEKSNMYLVGMTSSNMLTWKNMHEQKEKDIESSSGISWCVSTV